MHAVIENGYDQSHSFIYFRDTSFKQSIKENKWIFDFEYKLDSGCIN